MLCPKCSVSHVPNYLFKAHDRLVAQSLTATPASVKSSHHETFTYSSNSRSNSKRQPAWAPMQQPTRSLWTFVIKSPTGIKEMTQNMIKSGQMCPHKGRQAWALGLYYLRQAIASCSNQSKHGETGALRYQFRLTSRACGTQATFQRVPNR
jgi:hypothetical protein